MRVRRNSSLIRRGIAAGVGLFLAVCSVHTVKSGFRFDPSVWLIDLRPLPREVSTFILLGSALAMLSFAAFPAIRLARQALRVVCVLGAMIAAANCVMTLIAAGEGAVRLGVPIPLSLFTMFLFIYLAGAIPEPPRGVRGIHVSLMRGASISVVAGLLLGIGSVLQMGFFGSSDYRATAGLAVIFGARVYPDGSPSDALADRIRAGVELYEQGYATKLVMSGGPGEGTVSEPEAMRSLAMSMGIPANAIILDSSGFNTAATVANTHSFVQQKGLGSVLMVSHGYHLPRVKLECDRLGLSARTVPTRSAPMLKMPWFMAREVAAQWVYLIRPLV